MRSWPRTRCMTVRRWCQISTGHQKPHNRPRVEAGRDVRRKVPVRLMSTRKLHREPIVRFYSIRARLSEGASWRPFMDKQNEGIQDPERKVIPYDMGGSSTIRTVGRRKAIILRIRRRLIFWPSKWSSYPSIRQREWHTAIRSRCNFLKKWEKTS